MNLFNTHIQRIDLALKAYRELYMAVSDKSNYKFILIWIRLLSLLRSSLLLTIKSKSIDPLQKFHQVLVKQTKAAEERLQELYLSANLQQSKPLIQRIAFLKTLTTNLLLLQSETERLITQAKAKNIRHYLNLRKKKALET